MYNDDHGFICEGQKRHKHDILPSGHAGMITHQFNIATVELHMPPKPKKNSCSGKKIHLVAPHRIHLWLDVYL